MTKTRVLIVDDEPAIRELLSTLLTESGYRVRSAENGLRALAELREMVPDIILSDLHMPGMSGFEFLSVVLRRFPMVHTIAMSGAFSESTLPAGVAADAFYAKGGTFQYLIQVIEAMSGLEQPARPPQRSPTFAPIWISRDHGRPSGFAEVTITCPECFRAFSRVDNESTQLVQNTLCTHCSSLIHFAIVRSTEPSFLPVASRSSDRELPLGHGSERSSE